MKDKTYICVVQPNAAMLRVSEKILYQYDNKNHVWDKMSRNGAAIRNFLYLAAAQRLSINLSRCIFDFVRFPDVEDVNRVAYLLRNKGYHGVIFNGIQLNVEGSRKKSVILTDDLKKDAHGHTTLDRYKISWRAFFLNTAFDFVLLHHPTTLESIEGATYLDGPWMEYVPGYDFVGTYDLSVLFFRTRPYVAPQQKPQRRVL